PLTGPFRRINPAVRPATRLHYACLAVRRLHAIAISLCLDSVASRRRPGPGRRLGSRGDGGPHGQGWVLLVAELLAGWEAAGGAVHSGRVAAGVDGGERRLRMAEPGDGGGRPGDQCAVVADRSGPAGVLA